MIAKPVITAAAALTLLSCAAMYPPATVSDLSEDRVLVRAGSWNEPAEIQKVAADSCSVYGRSASGPIQRYTANSGWTYLFACTTG
ncbi:MAG TPA: hypothetical protein VJM79_08295 [Rhizorhapis sp.]|nr:hypothetical protein [Rhizorhapis sp.]